MDWTICAICQKDTGEELRCPLKATWTPEDKTEAYRTFLVNVNHFRRVQRLLVSVVFCEDVSVQDFVDNEAKWHKSCHKKFSSYRLSRVERKRDKEEAGSSEVDTLPSGKRHRSSTPQPKRNCLFYTKEEGHLHEFSTLGSDTNIRHMAICQTLSGKSLMNMVNGWYPKHRESSLLFQLTKLMSRTTPW